ncbi:hypothetical protein GCM10023191_035180 [Actinoallomurus oryzae]|uniref:DUF6603 domain-containing protein n=1 Tax=Actinoallomurus oryzae TaxID=502180 RepID=A0ABP8PZD1_9ACTN
MTLTLDQLRTAVRVTGARLDLPLTALDSTAITAAFGPFLPEGTFVLRDVTDRHETTAGVQVTGTGDAGPFTGMTVVADFAVTATDTTLTVTATGDSTWTFVTAFPALEPTLWNDLTYDTPRLVLSSTTPPDPGDPLAQIPMTFTGTLTISTLLAPLDLLFFGVTHELSGRVTVLPPPPDSALAFARVPSILLQGPEAPALDLGLLSITGRRYELYAIPRFDYSTGDYGVAGRLAILAGVPVTIGGSTTVVGLMAELGTWTDDIVLEADLSSLGDLAFEEVIAFARQQDAGLANPFAIDVGNSPVRLSTVSVRLAQPLGVRSMTLLLETTKQWDLGGGFVLDAVDLTFRLDDPFGSGRRLNGVVSGLLGWGANGTLEISADFGTRSLGGALREGDGPLNIREVFTDLTGRDPGHFPDLVVEQFEIFGAMPSGGPFTFQSTLTLTGNWVISDQVTLIGVGFDLEYGTDSVFTARAALLAGGVLIAIAAGYDSVKGWMFSGETGPGQRIPIGAFVDELAQTYGDFALPAPISQLTIENLAASLETKEAQVKLAGEARFPIDTTEVDLTVAIDTGAKTFGGRIVVMTAGGVELHFDVHLAKTAEATRYAVTYTHGTADPIPPVKDLVAALSPTAAAYIPDGITVSLKDAVLAVDGGTYVFGVDLTATLDLAKLPVVGPRLTGDQVVGFDPLRVIAASAALAAAEVTAVNGLLPDGVAALPEQDLAAGFTVGGRLRLGPLEAPVSLPVTPGQSAPTTPKQAQTNDNVLWYKVQTAYGPVQVNRVGVAYRHAAGQPATLAVLLDAAISVGGLTLSCDGLSAGISLSDLAAGPTFDLAGLGLSYSEGPVEISGAFLKSTITFQGRDYASYSGKAVIRTKAFSVGAIGSYVQLDSGPSMFVYAFLDYPIGGPAFFFVRGLAAGFGYNRRLIAPAVDAIADFPLVAEAVGTVQPSDLPGELSRLQDAIPPSPGDYFLAIGVHFTSFEMIDSFLLLTIGFGHRVELNVLGLSTVVLPAPGAQQAGVTPIAEIQLALKATFAPDDGYFALLAQLTSNSFLLDRACKLTGGFAFVIWFGPEHKGDFVLTAGGYHPQFVVPSHYPAVPRLGFNWKISDRLALKGTGYFALTPGALMAGGSLSATYEDGSLRAWFDTTLDFLIAWQPFHYQAAFHLSVGASYTFSFFGTHTITVQVGTDVRFWGPDFGGTAFIDLDVISFTIDFGAKEGDKAKPVEWDEFRDAQLPPAGKVVAVALQGGGLHSGDGTDLGQVDPLRLEIVTDSAIPSTGGRAGTTDLGAGADFGIAPVGLQGGFTSSHELTITRDGVAAESYFTFEPVTKSLPAAQWGDELVPTLKNPALVDGLLTGYVIRPVPPDEPVDPPSVPLADLRAGAPLFTEQDAFDWQPLAPYQAGEQPLDLAAGAAARAAIAGKLLPDAAVDLNGLTPADFLLTPQVAAHV